MRTFLSLICLIVLPAACLADDEFERHIKNFAAGTPKKDAAASLRALHDAGTTAFPTLVAHLMDQGEAEHASFDDGFGEPPTIGQACFEIIQGQVEGDWSDAANFHALKRENVKEWLEARRGFTLARLRKEALEDSLRHAEAELARYPSHDPHKWMVNYLREEVRKARYGEAFEEHLPPEFSRYQFLSGGLSPDEKLGILYPRRSDLFEMINEDRARLVLVRLSPMEVIADIPRADHCGLTLTGRDYYSIQWTRDSAAALMIQGHRWGPDRVYLIEMDVGEKPRFTNLAAHVAKKVRPSFKRSGLEDYNENFDFVFNDEGWMNRPFENRRPPAQNGWQLTDEGNVRIDCTCTNDPKAFPPGNGIWTVDWSGTWERKNQRFINGKMIRRGLTPWRESRTAPSAE